MMTPDEIAHMRKLANIGDDVMSFCVRRLCDEVDSMRADAELGAMVRKMQPGVLTRWTFDKPEWMFALFINNNDPEKDSKGDTPEEALRQAQP